MAAYPTDQEINTTFPDNDIGSIGADDLRQFQKEMTAAGRDYLSITENVPPPEPIHAVQTISDLEAIDTVPAPVVSVAEYINGQNIGGGLFKYDSGSTETANGITVFAPVVGGRFLRPGVNHITASEAGMRSSSSLDQSQQFQDFITLAMNERWTALMDIQDLNCGGASIWANTAGNAGGYEGGQSLILRGMGPRARCRIRNCNFTHGVFYYEDSGSGRIVWKVNTNASSQSDISDVNFFGAVRMYNVEGSMTMTRVNVFAEENDTTFYSSPPSDWSNNPAGWNDENDLPVADTPYAQYYNLLELLYLNHANLRAVNVQFANNIPEANPRTGGVSIAQCGNMVMSSGRITHCQSGMTIVKHPIYEGGGTNNFNHDHIHYEDIHERLIDIHRLLGGTFTGIGRPIEEWTGKDDEGNVTPAIHVRDTGILSERLVLDYEVQGRKLEATDKPAVGSTAIQVDGGIDVTVAGAADTFDVGVKVAGTTQLRRVSTVLADIETTPVDIAGTVQEMNDPWPVTP